MAIRVREELIRDVVRALDALHKLDDVDSVEPMLDRPIRFYSDDGRNWEFKIVHRFNEELSLPYFEVIL